MQKEYQLHRLVKRSNKDKTKTYNYALVLFNRENDSDLLRIYITDEQAFKLRDCLNNNKDDISGYVKVEYNSYQKEYQPKITI